MEGKRKVLYYGDVPLASTGFAHVGKSVLKRLYDTGLYDIDIVGINYAGDYYSREQYPYQIYPAVSPLSSNERARLDVYGLQKIISMAGSGKYDLVFILNDLFIIKAIYQPLLEVQKKLPKERKFEVILYFPVDSPLKPDWVMDIVSKCNFPVTYTQYGKNECLKHDPSLTDLRYFYHGTDKSVFFPFPKDDIPKLKLRMFGNDHANKYIVLNVNRNQPRKDLIRTFMGFKIFHDKYPNTFLFILAQATDVGGNLLEIAEKCGLVWDKDWACPAPGSYGASQGYPIEVVNEIYNASDIVVSTTLGEGWGLSITEGMATMKPVLFPKNTSLVEIIGENEERGWFIKSGEDMDHFVCLGNGDNNQIRPVINVFDMANKLEYIYTHPEEVRAKVERAYSEVWTWDDVCKEWIGLFDKAWNKVQIMRTPHPKVGRNDPCLCGSNRKWKQCCGQYN